MHHRGTYSIPLFGVLCTIGVLYLFLAKIFMTGGAPQPLLLLRNYAMIPKDRWDTVVSSVIRVMVSAANEHLAGISSRGQTAASCVSTMFALEGSRLTRRQNK